MCFIITSLQCGDINKEQNTVRIQMEINRHTVHLHFDCLIREYIYSLGLKLGSTLPPHSFRRAYIYSVEKIIIWSPDCMIGGNGIQFRCDHKYTMESQ